MDSQFKQRLTGAVILVLLAVLLVPELLTGPKSGPTGPTSSAAPPAQGEGAPLRSYDIDLTDSPQAVTPSEPRQAASEAEAPAPAAVVRQNVSPDAPPQVAGKPPVADDDAPGAAAPPTVPQSVTPPAAASAGPPRPDPRDAAPAAALRGFAVQVGSFASRASADRLAADLARRRFETFVSPVHSAGRQLFRVRVGPVPDRTAAQALADRLKAAGQKVSIVSLP